MNELEPLKIKKFDWRDCLIDLAKPVPPPEPLLVQTDTDISMFHRRNISTIAASAKVGKTFLISALAAAAFSEESFFNFYCPFDFVKVLFIDTEMDTSDTQEVTKRVHRIIGLPTDRNAEQFTVINLREQTQGERLQISEKAIKELTPDLVLLDGVVDLCENFNDINLSQTLVTRLTQLATENNCHICTALHVNKGNNELRGHLGAFLRQKGEITLLLTKKEAETPYIECKPIDSRHKPIDEFAFRINSEALPEIYEPTPKPPRTPKLDKLFTEIIPLPTSMSYADLWKAVAEKAKVKEAMAKRKISQAVKDGILKKNEAGYYHLQQSINTENETIPF
jgi:hypothetical protein